MINRLLKCRNHYQVKLWKIGNFLLSQSDNGRDILLLNNCCKTACTPNSQQMIKKNSLHVTLSQKMTFRSIVLFTFLLFSFRPQAVSPLCNVKSTSNYSIKWHTKNVTTTTLFFFFDVEFLHIPVQGFVYTSKDLYLLPIISIV